MKYSIAVLAVEKNRKRLDPQDRKEQLLTFYIAMVVGDIDISSDAPPCYLTVTHGDIAAASGLCGGSIFNYFNNVEDLQTAIEEWALKNLDSNDYETKRAAKHIASQWAAVRPISAQAKGIKFALLKAA